MEWVRKKVTAYAAKRFNITRGHVQTFTMKKTAGLMEKTGLFDISSVNGFRIASGGILGPLEDLRFWWRLNAFIGKIVPSLCTEIQVTAKRGSSMAINSSVKAVELAKRGKLVLALELFEADPAFKENAIALSYYALCMAVLRDKCDEALVILRGAVKKTDSSPTYT